MLHSIDDRDAGAGSGAAAREEELVRQEAIKRIEHKRRFWISTAVSTGAIRREIERQAGRNGQGPAEQGSQGSN